MKKVGMGQTRSII